MDSDIDLPGLKAAATETERAQGRWDDKQGVRARGQVPGFGFRGCSTSGGIDGGRLLVLISARRAPRARYMTK